MSKFKGQITLLIAAIIWGSSFIFQKMGMDFMSPFTFGFYRFFLGSLALLPVIEYSVLRVPLIRDRIPSVAQSVPLTY